MSEFKVGDKVYHKFDSSELGIIMMVHDDHCQVIWEKRGIASNSSVYLYSAVPEINEKKLKAALDLK